MVIGAGFIGLEVAENLAATGTRVTIVELADHVIAPKSFTHSRPTPDTIPVEPRWPLSCCFHGPMEECWEPRS